MEKANTPGTGGATGVVVALEPVSEMASDITDDQLWAATSVSFDHLAVAACPERVNRDGSAMSVTLPLHLQFRPYHRAIGRKVPNYDVTDRRSGTAANKKLNKDGNDITDEELMDILKAAQNDKS